MWVKTEGTDVMKAKAISFPTRLRFCAEMDSSGKLPGKILKRIIT